MNLRLITLFAITILATSSGIVAQTPAREATMVTPALLRDHPIDFPPHEIAKSVIVSQNGESRVVMTGSDELIKKEHLGQVTMVRYQSRTTADGAIYTDTVAFLASDFTPMSRISVSPREAWRIDFSSNGVSGTRQTKDGTQEVSGDFDQPFFDSNILDYLCLRLAQMSPGSYTTSVYQERSNSVGLYTIDVDPVGTVDFGTGPQDAIKVTYRSPDNRAATVWVESGTARVLREEANPSLGVQVVAEWKYQ